MNTEASGIANELRRLREEPRVVAVCQIPGTGLTGATLMAVWSDGSTAQLLAGEWRPFTSIPRPAAE